MCCMYSTYIHMNMNFWFHKIRLPHDFFFNISEQRGAGGHIHITYVHMYVTSEEAAFSIIKGDAFGL